MAIPTLTPALSLEGKRVMIRAGLNVPLTNGEVANAFRIKKVIETIRYVRSQNAKVLIVAHIGREKTDTLKPVFAYLSKEIPMTFAEDFWSDATREKIAAMQNGEVLMFENVRTLDGETDNDAHLAERLAAFADIYVNDAFPDSHRAHASVVGVPRYIPSYLGFQFASEVAALTKALSPDSPSVFILGGAKFETKEPILRACLPLYDTIFIGGALAHDFFRARGIPIGKSLASDHAGGVADMAHNQKILLPIDVTVRSDSGIFVKSPEAVLENDVILDCGPKTIALLKEKIEASHHVLWNGPLGNYEAGFSENTEKLARIIANTDTVSIVGGGDTVASIESLNLEPQFTFVSTGGGAMLDFLADGSLPGIDAIQHSPYGKTT